MFKKIGKSLLDTVNQVVLWDHQPALLRQPSEPPALNGHQPDRRVKFHQRPLCSAGRKRKARCEFPTKIKNLI